MRCVHSVRGHRGVLHPNMMHTLHTQTHHLGLPVTSCLEGKSCHSNKPQKRKYGYYDQTVLGPRLEKHYDVGTLTRQMYTVCV